MAARTIAAADPRVLLDIGSVLGGLGLAVVAFLVVILVCVVILRLLAAILPSYEERDAARLAANEAPSSGADPEATTGEPVSAVETERATEAPAADTSEHETHRAGADDQPGS
jgi:hypothetical protein